MNNQVVQEYFKQETKNHKRKREMRIKTSVGEISLWFEYGTEKKEYKNEVHDIRTTTCEIRPETPTIPKVAAVVHTYVKDNFVKKLGRKYALRKTLAKAGIDRALRTEIWQGYFQAVKI